MKPVMAAASTAATDDQLVAAIRDGSDDALEALFLRYRDRIGAYVRGIVPDQGKAEDIVQETFISALRSLRSTERTIAFRPWIYQIARNACIDQLRRQKRAQEISLDSDDFNWQDEGRISQTRQSTHGAVSQREDMYALRQAFGGLPESQHEVLVLRELEGLSYTEIASRMNLSPAAVESMLFRARRGLKCEYDEIATGERCRRMQPLIAAIAEGLGGARDRQALARHVRFCVGCRREALVMGLGSFVEEALRRGRMRRALHKAASLFPIPPFLRRRSGADGPDVSVLERLSARVQAPLTHLGAAGGPAAEHAAGALPKAVAVVAAAALIGGGGIVGQSSSGASSSASSPVGTGGVLSQPGLPGQPPGTSSAGQAAFDPFGSAGGLVQSGESSTAAQLAPAGQGGLIGLGVPAGVDGAAGPSGPAGPIDAILGGSGGLIGFDRAAAQSPSSGKVGDTLKKVAPQSVGGISLPQLPVGGSPPSGGGTDSNPGSGVGGIVPKVPVSPPKPAKPKVPSTPVAPVVPRLPTTPTTPTPPPAQVSPPVTPPNLLSTEPLPGVQVPTPPVPGLP